MISNLFRRSIVPLYRLIALISLYTILLAIVGYGCLVGFYFNSSQWIAPFTVNSSDSAVLTIMSQIVASQGALASLNLDAKQTAENTRFSRKQLRDLQTLDKKFGRTYSDQQKTGLASATDLQKFDRETQAGISVLTQDVSRGSELRLIIERDVATGLMTKADAIAAISNIDSLASQATSTKVAEKTLMDDIRSHQMVDFAALAVDAQRVQLGFQIGQLESTIQIDEAHAQTDATMTATIQEAIETARRSPYYVAMNSPTTVQLAVVPYNSSKMFQVHQPVYECMFGMVVCRYAGRVVAVYPNEQVFENPLSKMNTRGYLIQISVTPSSVRSKSLVVGRKPLFF